MRKVLNFKKLILGFGVVFACIFALVIGLAINNVYANALDSRDFFNSALPKEPESEIVTISDSNNTTKVNIQVNDYESQKSKFDSIKVEYWMYYNDVITRNGVYNKTQTEIEATSGLFKVDLMDYGKFTVKVTLFNGEVEYSNFSDDDVRVTADTYNLAPLNASLPVAMATINMFSEDSFRKYGPVIVQLERTNHYNWNALPKNSKDAGVDYGIYVLPFINQDQGANPISYWDHLDIMSDYIKELKELKNDSHFTLITSDNAASTINRMIYANKIEDYNVILYSDGEDSRIHFSRDFIGDSFEENYQINEDLKIEWLENKEEAYKTGLPTEMGKRGCAEIINIYSILCAEQKACFYINNKNNLKSLNDNNDFGSFVSKEENAIYNFNYSLKLDYISQNPLLDSQFKTLLNFNNNYFSEAIAAGKQPFVILGSSNGDNADLEDYTKIIMTYYGTVNYYFYYKGHPNNPIENCPFRQETYGLLGMSDVDASVPAELILYFNSNIILCGYGSSVFESVDQGNDKAMFRMTKDWALKSSIFAYHGCDFWSTEITEESDEIYKSKCNMNHKNFLLEFNDNNPEGYKFGIFDSTMSHMSYYSADTKNPKYSTWGKAYNCPIVSGTYIINSSLCDRKVIDIFAGSHDNGANVQLYNFNNTNAQKFYVNVEKGGYCTFRSVETNKFVDVCGGVYAPSTNIHQYDGNDTFAQKWLLINTDSGIKISSAKNRNLVIDIYAACTDNGANIQLYDSNNTTAQRFTFINANPAVPESDVQINPGDYYIKSPLRSDGCLGIRDNSADNGALIDMEDYVADVANNVFTIKVSEYNNKFYTIVNARTNKALDVDSGYACGPTKIQQWDFSSDNKNQMWAAYNIAGKIMFMNVASGLVLDLSGAQTYSGNTVHAYTRNDSDAQCWDLIPASEWELASISDGIYTISSVLDNNKVIEVADFNHENYGNVQLFDFADVGTQKWNFKTVNGITTITSVETGKALDIYGGNINWGSNVQQYESNHTPAQQWKIYKNTDGTFKIASVSNKYIVLDLSGGNPINRQNIQVWDSNGTNAQKWNIN